MKFSRRLFFCFLIVRLISLQSYDIVSQIWKKFKSSPLSNKYDDDKRKLFKKEFFQRNDIKHLRRTNPSVNHTIMITCQRRNIDKLKNIILEMADLSNPKSRKRMTQIEVNDFTMSPSSIIYVLQYLRSHDIYFNESSLSGSILTITATIQQWESIFDTKFNVYQLVNKLHNKSLIINRAIEYSLPNHLLPHVEFISQLIHFPMLITSNTTINQNNNKILEDKKIKTTSSTIGSGFVNPSFLRTYYNIPDSILGNQKTSQAVFGSLGQQFSSSDLFSFQIDNKLIFTTDVSPSVPSNINNSCTVQVCGQANLDLQYLMGISQITPTQYLYLADQSGYIDWNVALAQLNSMRNPPAVVSISYSTSWLDGYSTYFYQFDVLAVILAARGVTLIAISGDEGANFYRTSFPASSQYVTAVGATQGSQDGTEEIVCSARSGASITSGGGFSISEPAPSWQQPFILSYFKSLPIGKVPASGYSKTGRGIPDVSLLGLGYEVFINKEKVYIDGTSASASVFAGMVSLVNAVRLTKGLSTLGWINPSLYHYNDSIILKDITNGDNLCGKSLVSCSTTNHGFYAAKGWDPVSGLGSINFTNFLAIFTTLPTASLTIANGDGCIGCPIGQYCSESICYECNPNTFCPDGQYAYDCPPGQISDRNAKVCQTPAPSVKPSIEPTLLPSQTRRPTIPTTVPTTVPTTRPTGPSKVPTMMPSINPSSPLDLNIPYSEWLALQSLYASTNGKNWKLNLKGMNSTMNSTRWNFTNYYMNYPCRDEWIGIVCTCFSNKYYSTQIKYYYSPNSKLSDKCNIGKLVLESFNDKYNSLPSQIGQFPYLKVLSLRSIRLYGRIPTELGLLTNLRKLDLSFNYFVYQSIPSEIGNCTKLEHLDLSYNYLGGSIPFSITQLRNIKKLYLNNNYFLRGSIPVGVVGFLRNLTHLDLSSNYITGSIPADIGLLINLIYYNISFNGLIGPIPTGIGLLKNLTHLDLRFNILTGPIPVDIGLLTNLIYLDISINQMNGSIPSAIGKLNNLKQVIFGGPQYNSSLNTFITFYRDNLFTGPIPETFCLPKKPEFIIQLPLNRGTCYPICLVNKGYLSQQYIYTSGHCPWHEDKALCDFIKSTNVRKIISEYEGTPISQLLSSPHPIPNLYRSVVAVAIPNAISYKISFNGYCSMNSGRIFICTDSSDESTCTKALDCYSKSFNFTSPSFYLKYKYTRSDGQVDYGYNLLVTAKIAYTGWQCNDIPWQYPQSYKTEDYAANLAIYGNSYIVVNYCSWFGIVCVNESVTQISLNGLEIEGMISSSLSLLSNLQSLSLTFNKLIGTIPKEIFSIRSLSNLQLTGNALNGTIPFQVSNISSLSKVDLSSNKLTGSIPTTITKIKSLKIFNVNVNQLKGDSGQIPYSLCEFAKNVNLKVLNNNIFCYQPCGDGKNFLSDQKLELCIPTSAPTVSPSLSPILATINTEKSSDNSTFIIIIACSSGGAIILLFLLYYVFVRRKYNQMKNEKREELKRIKLTMLKLPIHSLLLIYLNDINAIDNYNSKKKSLYKKLPSDYTEDEVCKELYTLLEKDTSSLNQLDFKGRSAIDILLEYNGEKFTDNMILIILRKGLPCFINSSGNVEDKSDVDHGYAWIKVVSSHKVLTIVVEKILAENPLLCTSLSKAADVTGRSALDVAIPECRQSILFSLYFFKRYEILTIQKAHYHSQTCVIHLATDHYNNMSRPVALKFMKSKQSFVNEVSIRSEGNFDSQYILSIYESFDSDRNNEFRECAITKGFAHYPYLIVMPVADRNLNEIVTNGELIEETDLHFVRSVIIDIARCLNHLHTKDFVHCDIKPKNIMRSEASYKLIDLDGAARKGGFGGIKISSAFSPPELVFKNSHSGEYGMRQCFSESCDDNSNLEYELLSAHPSQDAWAFGMTIFFLMTNSNFFLSDLVGENICNAKDLMALYEFSESFKREGLNKVTDLNARNLLSNLLNKDPFKRPSMNQVLSHPFLSGKVPSRMIGDKPAYDIFLSYRVASDSNHVKLFYDMLTEKGLKVWLDQKCLEFGKPWEEGFIDGLCKSRVFVPVLSREAFVNSYQNILTLTDSSPIDNVLLEYRLAGELQKRNLIELVCPVMIGDFDHINQTYANYFKSGSHPGLKVVADVIVNSIEHRVMEVLDSQSLGMPLIDKVSIKDIMDNITKNQGCFLEGNKMTTINEAICKIYDAVKQLNDNDEEQEDQDTLKKINDLLDTVTHLVNATHPNKLKQDLMDIITTSETSAVSLQRRLSIKQLPVSVVQTNNSFNNNNNNSMKQYKSLDQNNKSKNNRFKSETRASDKKMTSLESNSLKNIFTTVTSDCKSETSNETEQNFVNIYSDKTTISTPIVREDNPLRNNGLTPKSQLSLKNDNNDKSENLSAKSKLLKQFYVTPNVSSPSKSKTTTITSNTSKSPSGVFDEYNNEQSPAIFGLNKKSSPESVDINKTQLKNNESNKSILTTPNQSSSKELLHANSNDLMSTYNKNYQNLSNKKYVLKESTATQSIKELKNSTLNDYIINSNKKISIGNVQRIDRSKSSKNQDPINDLMSKLFDEEKYNKKQSKKVKN